MPSAWASMHRGHCTMALHVTLLRPAGSATAREQSCCRFLMWLAPGYLQKRAAHHDRVFVILPAAHTSWCSTELRPSDSLIQQCNTFAIATVALNTWTRCLLSMMPLQTSWLKIRERTASCICSKAWLGSHTLPGEIVTTSRSAATPVQAVRS